MKVKPAVKYVKVNCHFIKYYEMLMSLLYM